MALRIGICAGEASGDLLGAGLIAALRARRPDLHFVGIGGPRMIAAGCESLYPIDRLAVIGLVEGAVRLIELAPVRRRIARHLIDWGCELFIGIDAPDFNLGLEASVHRAGVATVHYVSPSVWAWRQYRVRRMAGTVDRVLTLFPFEAAFYAEHRVAATFVGHPLANAIPLASDQQVARETLGVPSQAPIVALLPGSRRGEVQRLAGLMIGAAEWLRRRRARIQFVVAPADTATRGCFEDALGSHGSSGEYHFAEGRARVAMAAADTVLLASGTATLETLLVKRPMVICYRTHPLTWLIGRRLLKVAHVGLPNLLAGRRLVPELLQDQATPERLGAALLSLLGDQARGARLNVEFERIHRQLRNQATERAADAVLEVVGERRRRGRLH